MIALQNEGGGISMDRAEAEDLLFEEARMLDAGEFEGWLALFADPCLYWLPTVDGDPDIEPSLVYDDLARLQERVFRITSTRAHAQDPLSRTLHNVSNVMVQNRGVEGARVTCNLLVVELRPGDAAQIGLGQQRLLAGQVEYLFIPDSSGGARWRIALKKVKLINRDLPLYNITFII